jgi:hypothetical protein
MADPNIQLPSLPAAATVNLSDLMLIRQGSQDKKLTIQILQDLIHNNLLPADVLSKLLTVDGPGSGLNADLLDGQHGSFYQDAGNLNAGTIPQARLSAANILTLLLGVDGPGSGLNADLLDNQHGSFYQNAGSLNAGTVPQARLPTPSTTLRGAIELATQAEVNAGSDNSRAVTPFTLSNAITAITGIQHFGNAGSGALQIPYSTTNAFLINWGNNTIAANSTLTRNFQRSFTEVYQALITSSEFDFGADSPTIPTLSNTNLTLLNGAGVSTTVRFIAIGRRAI